MTLFDEASSQVRDLSSKVARDLPDLHNESPSICIPIVAGMVNIQKWIRIAHGREKIVLLSSIQAFVDLPATQRGLNLSRHNEAITEVVNAYAKNSGSLLENMAQDICVAVLKKHEYASNAHIIVSLKYPYISRTMMGFPSQQVCDVDLASEARRLRNKILTPMNSIAIAIDSAVACPLAQEMIKSHTVSKLILNKSLRQAREIQNMLKQVPFGTHVDRTTGRVELVFHDNVGKVSIRELIKLLESSCVAPFREMLKRPDELKVLTRMLEMPRFTEDCVRQIAFYLARKFTHLSAETDVRIDQTSKFALAAYEVVAKKHATLKELREELVQSG